MVVIEEWVKGICRLYAIVRDNVHLPDEHLRLLERDVPDVARKQASFIDMIVKERQIRQVMLRPELPNRGIYAMYKHSDRAATIGYSPSRMLCAYVSGSSSILVCGAGFLKQKDEPIQKNAEALQEALFLADIVRQLNERVENGEIEIVNNTLISKYSDTFTF